MRMGFISDKSVSIIGAPFNGGQQKKGVDLAPAYLRDAGLTSAIQALGWKVSYDKDVVVDPSPIPDGASVPISPKARNSEWVGAVCQRLHDEVYSRAKMNDFCLTIGGDHSIAIGSISAILRARPDTCIVWVDAHADINTPETSPSGNFHGMPVSMLMGLVKDIPGFEWHTPLLNGDRLAYVGLRDVDEGERALLRQYGIAAYSMSDVDRHGIAWVMDQVMARINPNRDRPVHISFDIDGLDPSVAPATGTPVPGGLTFREGRYICETLAQDCMVSSIDIVEVNPALSDPSKAKDTAVTAMQLILAALGRRLL